MAIPTCGELSPNDKNGPCSSSPDGHPQPCWCVVVHDHQDVHMCRCGEEWPRRSPREPVDIIERVAIVGVQPGDVLVFEAREDATDQELDAVAQRIQQILGDDTLSIVINGKLGGALRREGSILVESTSFSDLAKGQRTYLVGGEA